MHVMWSRGVGRSRLLLRELVPARAGPGVFSERLVPLSLCRAMELIVDFVGVVRGREARIIRQLTEMLPKAFVDNQNDVNSGESSIDESSSELSSSWCNILSGEGWYKFFLQTRNSSIL